MLEKIDVQFPEVGGTREGKSLIFFSLSTCVMCKKGIRYLEETGFPYRLVYVDQLDPDEKDQLKEELSKKCNMRVVFPALLVDGNRIVLGFVPHAWDEALGEAGDE